MTLQKCIDKHGFGNGQRYMMEHWTNLWFEPKLLSPNKTSYIGFTENGGSCWFYTDGACKWQYIAPEHKKIVRWLWAKKGGAITCRMHSEEEMKGVYATKLEWSRTEFIEE